MDDAEPRRRRRPKEPPRPLPEPPPILGEPESLSPPVTEAVVDVAVLGVAAAPAMALGEDYLGLFQAVAMAAHNATLQQAQGGLLLAAATVSGVGRVYAGPGASQVGPALPRAFNDDFQPR